MKNILKILLTLIITFLLSSITYADVPFDVWKTKTTAEAVLKGNYEEIVRDWKIINDNYDEKKQGVDTRVKTVISSIDYKLTFRNVWKMWNEGWTSLGGYDKAKLVISFNVKESYHMHDTWIKHPMFNLNMYEKVKDEPQYVDDMIFDLTFSWWPYWVFTYKSKDWVIYQLWHVVDWRYVQLEYFPYKMTHTVLGLGGIKIPVEDKMFGKWMEILLKEDDSGCIDSWIRFSDYNWEVMVRPGSDEDAWYWAELDQVLCVNDHVKTWDDSSCVLSMADMTTFVMSSNSEVILTTPPKKDNKLKLIGWKILVNIKRMFKDGTMDVEMSQAVAWARWTIFELDENGKESKLKVFQWIVEFTSKVNWQKSLLSPWETQTATSKWLLKKTTRSDHDIYKELKKDKKNWDKIKTSPLKPLLSQAEINKINKKDPNRWEIKLAPWEIAPDWSYNSKKDNGKSKNKEEKSSNNTLLLIVLILLSSLWFYYLKNKKIK